VPVITADPQKLNTKEQDQAARNIGAVRTVEPEQFPGGSDDVQFTAALESLGTDGGVIRLRPGKQYTWQRAIPVIDWSTHGGLVITAWGATVNYPGDGSAFTSQQSRTRAGTHTLTVHGGEWVAPKADAFFTIIDSGNHLFYRCRGEVPNGTFFHLSNKNFWSERNHFIEIEDHNCREAIRFSIDGSVHESFARTFVKDLRLTGGQPGYPKINIITHDGDQVVPAPYDSCFDGVVGNIPEGVIVQRLAGGMSGTRIGRFQIEAPKDATAAAVWQVGPLVGKLPMLPEGPPILRNLLMFTPDSVSQNPFAHNVAQGGLAVQAALTMQPFTAELNKPGPVTVPADLCNAAVITLNAPCTESTITTALDHGASQTLTVVFRQGAAGGFGYAWPSSCRFAKGKAPTDTTANTQTSVTFLYSGGVWLETARAEGVPIG